MEDNQARKSDEAIDGIDTKSPLLDALRANNVHVVKGQMIIAKAGHERLLGVKTRRRKRASGL